MARREIETEELKKLELDVLIAFRDYCEENGIRYFFTGGTLLGAVRHGGFIPWDDDIDVVMPRKDYERFLAEYPKDGRYKVINRKFNKDFYAPYSKLVDTKTEIIEQKIRSIKGMGAFIDIFPLDGLGDSEEVAKANVRKSRKFFHYASFCRYPYFYFKGFKGFFKNFLILYSFITKNLYFKAIDNLGAKHSFEEDLYVGCSFGYNKEREVLERSIFEGAVDMKFEGETFKVPVGYKAYLTSFYDDYMQLPPEEKRVTHHSFKAYWKE